MISLSTLHSNSYPNYTSVTSASHTSFPFTVYSHFCHGNSGPGTLFGHTARVKTSVVESSGVSTGEGSALGARTPPLNFLTKVLCLLSSCFTACVEQTNSKKSPRGGEHPLDCAPGYAPGFLCQIIKWPTCSRN